MFLGVKRKNRYRSNIKLLMYDTRRTTNQGIERHTIISFWANDDANICMTEDSQSPSCDEQVFSTAYKMWLKKRCRIWSNSYQTRLYRIYSPKWTESEEFWIEDGFRKYIKLLSFILWLIYPFPFKTQLSLTLGHESSSTISLTIKFIQERFREMFRINTEEYYVLVVFHSLSVLKMDIKA